MRIVIDIPKYIADMCVECGCVIDADTEKVGKAIKNGIPLPKGHGRLIDADAIEYTHVITRSLEDGHNWNELCVTENELYDTPTIIEADKEYEAEVITHGNCMICEKELDEGLFFCKECEAKAESEVG